MVYRALQRIAPSPSEQQESPTYHTATLHNVPATIISRRLAVLKSAVKNAAPQIVFRSSKARFGRRTALVPIETRSYHSIKKAVSWIVEATKHGGKSISMDERLASSILEAASKTGFAFSKKKALHARARKSSRRPKRAPNSRTPRTPTTQNSSR
mmetsp:Transcript_48832/g.91419  ORF Transcript_48832/g.91419 Transcript_48832/m.91419 type:complete len:155 (-) Transcript_48832:2-466(-)